MTCGVFASILSSFVLYLVLYFVLLLLCLPFFLSSLLLLLSLFLLSSACPLGCLASDHGLVLSLCGLLFLFPLRLLTNDIICERCGRFLCHYCIDAHCIRISYHHSHIIAANDIYAVRFEYFKKFCVICYYLFHCFVILLFDLYFLFPFGCYLL